MNMLRLQGKGGVQVYDSKIWTEEEARADYLSITGYEPNKPCHTYSFDVLPAQELIDWVRAGVTE